MENWLIAAKFTIIIYCFMKYILGETGDFPVKLLAALIYISLSMLYYLLSRRDIKGFLLFLSTLAIVLFSLFVSPLFVFLLPLNILELTVIFTEKKYMWAVLSLSTAALCKTELLPEFIIIGSLSLLIFILANTSYSSFTALKRENEALRDKNENLKSRINKGTEYENQVKYLSQLEERNSLAQKIHDKVGHTIAGSLIQLEAASLIIDKDREKAVDILQKVINHLKDGMESIRSTLRNIKPATEQLGINRLKVILEEFSLNNSIKTELSYRGSLDVITHSQWNIIMDNTKEALTNSLKYSNATLIKVDVEVMNKLIKAEIRDNGQGASKVKKGLGIIGMEERTENSGGKLIIDGSRGFSIIMLLPVSAGESVR